MPTAKTCFEYETYHEGENKLLKIYVEKCTFPPSIEYSEICMAKVVDVLLESSGITTIILSQLREYEYDFSQTSLLLELAQLYRKLNKEERYLYSQLIANPAYERYLRGSYAQFQNLVSKKLKEDPLAAYVELKRLEVRENVKLKNTIDQRQAVSQQKFVQMLQEIIPRLEQLKIIGLLLPHTHDYAVGKREIYGTIFHPTTRPDFMYTKLVSEFPDGELVESYEFTSGNDTSQANIFRFDKDIKIMYHLTPPEFQFTEEEYGLLDDAKRIMSEHKPTREEFVDPERMREVFFSIGKDLITDLIEHQQLTISEERVEQLAQALLRYTVGFGLIELLLSDHKIQDVNINSPNGELPIFIVHQDYGDCYTNIYPTRLEVESWATKLRLISGRPLDEANPILDTELKVTGFSSRVAAITAPLNPSGLAFSFRRHRDYPWTFPLYMQPKVRYMNTLSAGLLSFLIDNAATILVAGTRSSGKCLQGPELIQLPSGELKSIQELIEKELKNGKTEISDGWVAKAKNIEILSLNKDFKIEKKPVQYVWKRKAGKLLKITLHSGKEITCTPEHPFFIMNEMEFQQIRADQLKRNLHIATARRYAIEPNEEQLRQKIKNFTPIYRTNAHPINIPSDLLALLEFVGYIYGDGHIDKSKTLFTSGDTTMLRRFQELASQLFGYSSKIKKDIRKENTYYITLTARTIARFLHEIFEIPYGNKARILDVPNTILQLPDELCAAFLRALFDCDGNVSKTNRQVELYSASKKLLDKSSSILHRFGIHSILRKKIVKEIPYYILSIRGREVVTYAKNINFLHPRKKELLQKIVDRKTIDLTLSDSIPQGAEIIRNLRQGLRVSPSQLREATSKDYWAYEVEKYQTTQKWFAIIIKYFKKRYISLQELKPQIRRLQQYLEILAKEEEISRDFKKLHTILGVSLTEFSKYTQMSRENLNKILDGRYEPTIKKFSQLIDSLTFFQQKIEQQNCTSSWQDFVEHTPYTLSGLARRTEIPYSTLHSYFYGGINLTTEKKAIIENVLSECRQRLFERIKESKVLVEKLSSYKWCNQDAVQHGILIQQLRQELNITNEELAQDNLSIGTISNFFNGTYKPTITTTLKIGKKVVEIYEKAFQTKKALSLAEKLADADIHWDKVVRVEESTSKEEWVYDFTVEYGNFIANGIIAHNTSLLGSFLVEIMRRTRIITIEDTFELPQESMRKLGYNIESLKVASALSAPGSEVDPSIGIRSTLRLGDSAIIVGEVRSKESIALFEAMRVGAAANVVAGTIHADSPYGVYDRVVNDIGVPKTSFKAIDIIVTTNPVISGLKKYKRILRITEVRKEWDEDPLKEGAFVDLMVYNPITDQLEITDELRNGNSVILKTMAGRIKEFAGDWDAVWNNIQLRSDCKQAIVDLFLQTKDASLLEADFVIKANDIFHLVSDRVKEEKGKLDSAAILFEYQDWLKKEGKRRKMG